MKQSSVYGLTFVWLKVGRYWEREEWPARFFLQVPFQSLPAPAGAFPAAMAMGLGGPSHFLCITHEEGHEKKVKNNREHGGISGHWGRDCAKESFCGLRDKRVR